MELTDREKAFCHEYVSNGYVASRAYEKIYQTTPENARSNAYKVFKKPQIKEYIGALQKEIFDASSITAERVAMKLAEIAFSPKDDNFYSASAQLKALDLLQKQFGLQKQKIEAEVNTDINITIDE